MFNVTNPNEIRKGAIPVVQEIGPYEFIEKKEWTLYDWQADDTLLDYKMTRRFFHNSNSKGNLDDRVTMLNVPLVVSVVVFEIQFDLNKFTQLSPFSMARVSPV